MDKMYEVTVNREALQGGYNQGPAGPGGGDPLRSPNGLFVFAFPGGHADRI